jgi:hypothetical protein
MTRTKLFNLVLEQGSFEQMTLEQMLWRQKRQTFETRVVKLQKVISIWLEFCPQGINLINLFLSVIYELS